MPDNMGAIIKANADVMLAVGEIDMEKHIAIYREVDRHIEEERKRFFEELKAHREAHARLPWWRRFWSTRL